MNLPFPLNKFFNNQNSQDDELLYSYGHGLVSAATQQSPSDIEMRKELDINIHMIEDEGLVKKLDNLCTIEVRRPYFNEDGTMVFRKDAQGNDVPAISVEYIPRPWALSARTAISKVTPTRNITAFDVETYKLELENTFEEIKEKMSPSDLSLFGEFLDLVLLYAKQSLDDAVGGQKSLVLKMNSKRYEVDLRKPIKQK
jgi:hypothetical protein